MTLFPPPQLDSGRALELVLHGFVGKSKKILHSTVILSNYKNKHFNSFYMNATSFNCSRSKSVTCCALLTLDYESGLSFHLNYSYFAPISDDDMGIFIRMNKLAALAVDIVVHNKQQNSLYYLNMPDPDMKTGNSLQEEDSLLLQITNMSHCLFENRKVLIMVEDLVAAREISLENFEIFRRFEKSYMGILCLSCLHPKVFISIPGRICEKIYFNLSNISHVLLVASWIPTVAQRYVHHSCFSDLESCYNTEIYQTTSGKGKAFIFNLSSRIYHFRFRNERSQFNTSYTTFNTSSLWLKYNVTHYHSWNSANKLCHNIGGLLPAFYGRRDLENFVSFLKVRPDLPLVESIFIGLYFVSEKVTYLFLIEHCCNFSTNLNETS